MYDVFKFQIKLKYLICILVFMCYIEFKQYILEIKIYNNTYYY